MDQIKAWVKEWIPYEGRSLKIFIASVLIGALILYLLVLNIVFSLASTEFSHLLNPGYVLKHLVQGSELALICGGVSFLVIGVVALLFWIDYRRMGLHGRADWANEWQIRKSGLRDMDGLLLGKRSGKFLCSNTEGFIFGYAPTGTGKSVGFVIPNLLNFKDSTLVLDTKLELFKKTSGFRSKFQKVFLWAPGFTEGYDSQERTHCFNPLDVVSRDPLYRIADLKRIAAILWPSDQDKGDIWQPSARTIFTTMAMDLMDTGTYLTFGNLYRAFSQTNDLGFYLETQLEAHFDENHSLTLDALEVANINNFLHKAPKERSGLISTYNTKMEIFEDPLVDAACSRSDFDVRTLRKERTTIYIGVNPSDIERLQPLLNLFFQMTITFLTRKEPDETEPYKVFLCLDEFPRLGKIEKIKEGIDYLRSFGFRIMIVAQSMAKIKEVYGEYAADNFMNNFQYIAAYAPNAQKEAEEISRMLGKKTVRQQTRSHSKSGVSVSTSLIGRELMKADEVRRFTEKKCIIIVRNKHPVKCNKIKWYQDKELSSRVIDPIQVPLLNAREYKKEIDAKFLKAVKRKVLPEVTQLSQADQEELVNVASDIE